MIIKSRILLLKLDLKINATNYFKDNLQSFLLLSFFVGPPVAEPHRHSSVPVQIEEKWLNDIYAVQPCLVIFEAYKLGN